MDSTGVAISHINSLKRSNCQSLMTAMNCYWTQAAFSRTPLDGNVMVALAQKVRDNARSIIKICQDQSKRGQELGKRSPVQIWDEPLQIKHRKVVLE